MTDIRSSHEVQMPTVDLNAELEFRFDPERIQQMSYQLLAREGIDSEAMGDRSMAIVRMNGDDEFADIPLSLETSRFASAFDRTLEDVYLDYGLYNDSTSQFIAILDTLTGTPVAAARLIGNSPKGLKDFEVLVSPDDSHNPWIGDIMQTYFAEGEMYNPEVAKDRIVRSMGFTDYDPELAYDVATRVVNEDYSIPGFMSPGMALLHTVLDVSVADGKNFLVAIQDVGPFKMIQRMGKPFIVPQGLQPRPFGGPKDTVPSFARLTTGFEQMREMSPKAAAVLIDGAGLSSMYRLVSEAK